MKKFTEKERQEQLKQLVEIQKKMEPFVKRLEQNHLLIVCKEHKRNKAEVKELRIHKSWRGVARATSNGTCANQICGWFLCIWAGVSKGPWEEE